MISHHYFIVGMSRAGTTWLGKCLNTHPDVAVFGESLFWGRGFIEPNGDFGTYTSDQLDKVLENLKLNACSAFIGNSPGNLRYIHQDNWNKVINELHSEISPFSTPGEIFSALSSKIISYEKKKIAIEKTPHHVNWISRIVSFYPEARFVMMLRSPYEFMLSYKHQGDRYEVETRKKFQKLYHPIACSFLWRAYFRSILSASSLFPNQTLIVVTEKMKQHSEEILTNIQSFLSLNIIQDLSKIIPQDNSSFTSEERPSLSKADIFWMNLIAGNDIRKHGKEFEFHVRDTPISSYQILLSILSFPLWIIWAAIHIYRSTESSIFKYLGSWIRRFI